MTGYVLSLLFLAAGFFGGLFHFFQHLAVEFVAALDAFHRRENLYFPVSQFSICVVGQFLFNPEIESRLICPVGLQLLSFIPEVFQNQTQRGVHIRRAIISIEPERASPILALWRALHIDLEAQTGFFIQLVQDCDHIGKAIQLNYRLSVTDQVCRRYGQHFGNGVYHRYGRFNFTAFVLLDTIQRVQQQQVDIEAVEQIKAKPLLFSSKVSIEREDYEKLATAAEKYVVQEKQESTLKRLLKEAKKTIADLKNTITDLKAQLAAAKAEIAKYKSVRGDLRTGQLEQENKDLRSKLRRYEEIIDRNSLWAYFSRHRGKTHMRDDAR
mgnify:CR=1 FL=1